jgi:putative ABC transport system permease protein
MSFIRDLRIAVRHLLQVPVFTTIALMILALGIGATTAVFSLVEGVLLRGLPFPHPAQLVTLSDILHGAKTKHGEIGVTSQDVKNYMRDTHSFDALGGYQQLTLELSGVGDPVAINTTRMSAGAFSALQVSPMIGRLYSQNEDDTHERLVVLSYSFWQSRFHADRNVLGTKLFFDRNPYIVVGVMPPSFEFPLVAGHLNRTELWIPLSLEQAELTGGGAASWSFAMVGRLKDGISKEQARDDAERVAGETMRGYPAFMSSLRITPVLHSLQEATVSQARPLIRALFLSVLVILAIACANLAGLQLVRAIRKRRDFAVRLALGANAGVLLRHALVENLVLSGAGAMLGLGLATVLVRVGVAFLPENLPRINEIGLDWPLVWFALALAILTGVTCGLAAAFASINTNVSETLKESGRTGSHGSGHGRLRSALVVGEIAIALVLLTASGLLFRSFEKMREVSLGFRPDHSLVASYSLPSKQYSTQTAIDVFHRELLRRLQELPGVQDAALSSFLPVTNSAINTNSAFVADGGTQARDGGIDLATAFAVEGNYFQAVGTPLLRGRLFTEGDSAKSQLVAIVSRKLAEQSWPGQDPIGKRIRLGTRQMQTPWMNVVGEVDDVKENAPDTLPKQQFYQPIAQSKAALGAIASPDILNGDFGYIVLRTSTPPEQMLNLLRSTVASIDPQLALTQLQTMEHAMSESEAPRRFNTVVIASFAALAVGLAVLGIYSIMAFSVALRVQELAIRIALGSQRAGIFALILSSGVKLALAGCLLGVLGAIATARLIGSLLFGISPFDPVAMISAITLVLILASMASLIPAIRAARTNPIHVLRG